MVKGLNVGLTGLVTEGNTLKARSMELEIMNGLISLVIRENGCLIRLVG